LESGAVVGTRVLTVVERDMSGVDPTFEAPDVRRDGALDVTDENVSGFPRVVGPAQASCEVGMTDSASNAASLAR
jgi:hypothetical protein